MGVPFSSKNAINFSMNLPRYVLAMAFIGNKKSPFDAQVFQLFSFVNPPPGTIICTCGCRLKFCPHVCKIEIAPIWAPRCFGSCPNAKSVSLLTWKRMLYISFGCFKQNWLSSCGIVNTTWKYVQSNKSSLRAKIQRSRFVVWHFGQWRFLHELYAMRSCLHWS